jgi:hypothetical protein
MYRTESTRLQTRALALYSAIIAREEQEPSHHLLVPIFLFSTFLGQHVLYDTFSFYNGNTNLDHSLAAFLDQLVHCLGLHRGIAAVAGRSWPTLMSELRARLGPDANSFSPENTNVNGNMSATTPAGRECAMLRSRITGDGSDGSGGGSEMSSTSREACCAAVDALRQMFDAQSRPGGDGNQLFIGVQKWLVCVPGDYINLLARRQPEALVVLAYYAVMLHQARDHWVAGNAGCALIRSIVGHLGGYWSEWLEWPMSILRSGTSSCLEPKVSIL